MRKFLTLLVFAAAVIAVIIVFNGRNGNALQDEQSSFHKTRGVLPSDNSANIDILLVNANSPLHQNYIPADLINLFEQKERHFQLSRSDIEICKVVFDAMQNMFSAAKNDGIEGFIITSGYRSREKQIEIFANTSSGFVALPGTSEHESGLAFDVTAYGDDNFELTPQFEWLLKNCGDYGFILRYPEGKEDITGFPYEPWHYRYVGTPYAKEIMSLGISLKNI